MPRRPLPPSEAERLAAAMRAERGAQGLSQQAAASRGGVSSLTWSQVERGATKPRDFTLAGIDRGLRWPPGTAAAVAAGADPPPLGSAKTSASSATTEVPADLGAQLARLQATVDAIALHLGVRLDGSDGGTR